MISWLKQPPPFASRAADLVEMFAGKARISRLAKSRGYHVLCHDWNYDVSAGPETHNCMDMCGNAGFLLPVCVCFNMLAIQSCKGSQILCSFCNLRLAILMILCGDRALICIGLECSTFTFMNAATSRRSVVTPMGNTCRVHVAQANTYASRPVYPRKVRKPQNEGPPPLQK